jgi:hypothetical protein
MNLLVLFAGAGRRSAHPPAPLRSRIIQLQEGIDATQQNGSRKGLLLVKYNMLFVQKHINSVARLAMITIMANALISGQERIQHKVHPYTTVIHLVPISSGRGS